MELWSILRENSIFCTADHISGVDNSLADFFSRYSHLHEFFLRQSAFNKLTEMIPFEVNLDLFASRDNAKLSDYVSLFNDSQAFIIDAFSFTWPSNVYIFPPIPLIPKALMKALRDDVEFCLFITPAWTSLSMIPLLKKSLISLPILISSDHVLGCLPTRHPFHLMAWPISASYARRKRFQQRSSKPCSEVSQILPFNHIRGSGLDLVRGLCQENLPPFYLQI